MLNNSQINILPPSCQASIKKLICSNVYLKCPPGIDLSSPTYQGWNINIYSDVLPELTTLNNLYPAIVTSPYVPLPFQRPCQSVCDMVNANCLGILKLIGLSQNCSSRYDYSRGSLATLYSAFPWLPLPFKYDSSNNFQVCNPMLANVTVAGTKEIYLKANDPSGACYGITKELFIPPANSLNSALAPMQGPYLVQAMLERQLSSNFNSFPVSMSATCHSAIKKYFCSSFMLAPSAQSLAKALQNSLPPAMLSGLLSSGVASPEALSYIFYLPSYPHQSICQEYASACADFIVLSRSPQLQPQCTAVRGGIQSYPSENQTIVSLPLTIGGATATINFRTPPNLVSTATSDYQTLCPDGYVVPDKYDKRTKWVTGTGCAVACRPHILTRDEYHSIELLSYVMGWIGLPMVLLLLVTWVMDKERRKQYLVICFGVMSLITTVIFAASPFLSFQRKFCATNAVSYDKTDGATFCSVEVAASTYAYIGMTTSWALLSFDLFLKVVMNIRNSYSYRAYFIGIVVLLPIPFMGYSLTTNFQLYTFLPFCVALPDDDLASMFILLTILTCFGAVCMVFVIIQIIRNIRSNADSVATTSEDPPVKGYQTLWTPIIFSICFMTFIISFLVFRARSTSTFRNEIADSFSDFTKCIFKSFDGTDESWRKACGTYPSYRPKVQSYLWLMTVLSGQAVLISIIYLSQPSAWACWGSKGNSTQQTNHIGGFSDHIANTVAPATENP